MTQALLYAFYGTSFTFLITTLGASLVFLVKQKRSLSFEHALLGFSAGVMIAASIWSLLLPAIDSAQELGTYGWLPSSVGFLGGGLFLLLLDYLMDKLPKWQQNETGKRNGLFVFAVTLHNIPEGMAVGLAFALATQSSSLSLASAIALAIGIGLQNFPEGASISLPLHQAGHSKGKAFLIGTLSGIVEPIAGVCMVFGAKYLHTWMPWVLSFAAGAMIYVVVEELIPEHHNKVSHKKTIGILIGFTIMMILDVALS